MTDLELILFGVALGAIPSAELGRLAVAAIAQRMGLKPSEIKKYNAAADDDS